MVGCECRVVSALVDCVIVVVNVHVKELLRLFPRARMGVGVDLLCFVAIDIVLNTGLSCLLHRVFYDLFEGCVVEGIRVCLCCCSGLKEGLIRCVLCGCYEKEGVIADFTELGGVEGESGALFAMLSPSMLLCPLPPCEIGVHE